mgnify:CR=1 FL=1
MKSDCKTRIIIDTNLWISFLIGKKLAGLLDFLSDEKVELVVSNNTVMEFDVLASSSGYSFFVHEDSEDYYHLVVRE